MRPPRRTPHGLAEAVWEANSVLTGARLQLVLLGRDPNALMPLAATPLLTVVLVAIVDHAGRHDLAQYALLAPVLMTMWSLAVFTAGDVVDSDRWQATLDLQVASPSSFAFVVLGRVLAVSLVGLLAFGEVALAGWLVFDVTFRIRHPVLFTLALLCTVVAAAGTALVMAVVFVLARSARSFQNALSYPVFVLSGVLVPVAFLPEWLRPISRVVFLSWSAALLRESLDARRVANGPWRLGAILALAAAGFGLGFALLAYALRRARASGSLGHA